MKPNIETSIIIIYHSQFCTSFILILYNFNLPFIYEEVPVNSYLVSNILLIFRP